MDILTGSQAMVIGIFFFGLLAGYAAVQVVTTVVLVRRLIRRPENLSKKARGLLMASLALLPMSMMFLNSIAFCSGWKGHKGLGVFGVLDEEAAGLIELPLWLIGAVCLIRLLTRPQKLWSSKPAVLVLATMAFVALWHTLRTAIPAVTGVCDNPIEAVKEGLAALPGASSMGPPDPIMQAALFFYLLSIPGMLTLNLLLLIVHILQRRQLAGRFWAFAAAWLGGLAATVWAKIMLASHYYAKLPDEPPDCFIVSAAARGHGRLVGRRAEPGGRIDTLQLRHFRRLEEALRRRAPAAHAVLRRNYNRLAPPVARVIAASPLLADATYLALKPMEWLAALFIDARRGKAR